VVHKKHKLKGCHTHRKVKIVVNDTNILIDLADLELLGKFAELDYELHTNDFILSEIQNPEQLEKINTLVKAGKLTVSTTKAEDYPEIAKLQTKNLSFEDCSIWYYAKKIDAMLLTGDGNLRKSAQATGIEVRGMFFVFDQLLENKIIDCQTAITKLELLKEKNNRLPKDEFEKRINEWK